MKKVKYLIIFLVLGAILLVPSITKAETLTYTDSAQNIEWSYELDSDENNVINLKCNTKTATGTVNIPSSINGKPVISLKEGETLGANSAFDGCKGITGINVPSTITKIPSYAFYELTGLTSVSLPNTLIEIGNSAFDNCSALKNITIPNTVTKIGNFAFSGCSGIKSIVVPNSVTALGSSAFSNCSGLTSVTLSNKITVIEQNTFYNCSGLKSLIIPDSVTTIESGNVGMYAAFYGCNNLEKVLIPDSVVTIEDDAFRGCSKLTIYGNDGQASKEYAEENEIPFDYIANWDKQSSGSDITPPTVQSIDVGNTSGNYDSSTKTYMVPTGRKLTITVDFSEEIEGTTVPTLTIKFGSGKDIELTNGTIQGDKIIYTYTVKSTDSGVMKSVEYKGGNIKDIAGNTAVLSCPKLGTGLLSASTVYANGTASGSQGGGNTQNGGTTGDGDGTTATGKLPQTGIGFEVIFAVIAVAGISALCYVKYRSLKDI